MKKIFENCEIFLKSEFQKRLDRNPQYTLRSFARDLNIGTSTLSEYLNGGRRPSSKMANKIAEQLKLSDKEKEYFVLLAKSQSKKEKHAEMAQEKLNALEQNETWILQLKSFEVIRQWYHMAILELTYLKQFTSDPQWIARQLGISLAEVNSALARLFELGLLEQTKDGRFRDTKVYLKTNDTVPSRAIKDFHQSMLKKASIALEEQAINKREFSNSLFAIDSDDIPKIKEEIKAFRRKLIRKYSNQQRKDAVYNLSIQLYKVNQEESL